MERLAQKRPFETRDGVTKPAIAFGTNRAAVDDDDPDRPDGEAGRYARLSATSYTVEGIAAAAAIEYERSLKRAGPGYPGLVHALASCLIAAKKLERAQEVLGQSAGARNPDDPRTHVLLGRLRSSPRPTSRRSATGGRTPSTPSILKCTKGCASPPPAQARRDRHP